MKDFEAILAGLARVRVLVVGDPILDRYTYGVVDRISQEAPVPVLRPEAHECQPGGAAAVAAMIRRLGADVILAGVVGDDAPARRLRRLLGRAGLTDLLLVPDRGRPTASKRRFIDRGADRPPHQLLRLDREATHPIPDEVEGRLLEGIEARVRRVDIVIVSDYAKGVCTPRLLRHVLEAARGAGRRVLVDPARVPDYAVYRGATCLTPNRAEARDASGLPASTSDEALAAAERLRSSLGAEAVVVTLDKQGMALAHADGRRRAFPTRPCRVRDVSGAGDMAISVLGACLALGVDYEEAIPLANLAAGLAVRRMGAVPLTPSSLLRGMAAAAAPPGRMPTPRDG
jgi:D-beta-D-heptose 7-phosphate kinase/D-beta-D-heptose 1-phosphate adenosyltransferase